MKRRGSRRRPREDDSGGLGNPGLGNPGPGNPGQRRIGQRRIRIVAGALHGRVLAVPPGLTVRPMRSRIRQSLFDLLRDRIHGARVLDLFSGSGAIGIEALSRGAREAVMVEQDPDVLRVLERNVDSLALRVRARVVAADVHARALPVEPPFDLVFLDPPFGHYGMPERDPWKLAAWLADNGWVAADGTIGLEHPGRVTPPAPPPGHYELASRRHGDTAVTLWRQGEPV